jgi:hypothetical protein
MFKLTPRFLLSPRFFALPLIALAVIIALSQNTTRSTATVEVASPKIFRAINCSDPARANTAACAVAGDPARTVR